MREHAYLLGGVPGDSSGGTIDSTNMNLVGRYREGTNTSEQAAVRGMVLRLLSLSTSKAVGIDGERILDFAAVLQGEWLGSSDPGRQDAGMPAPGQMLADA